GTPPSSSCLLSPGERYSRDPRATGEGTRETGITARERRCRRRRTPDRNLVLVHDGRLRHRRKSAPPSRHHRRHPPRGEPRTTTRGAPPAAAAVHTPSARPLPSPSGNAAVGEDNAEGATI
ncbi:MAG: hypothetical protein AVDCRST_MAG55-3318, partial [uncultured Rubrobacteraceae bacterium]